MAKEEKGASIEAIVTELAQPAVESFIGTIVGISERAKSAKFKHDTKIITLMNILTNETKLVFVTSNQWKEYGCDKYFYSDNIVRIEVEKCIANVTGYKALPDDLELTAHDQTFDAFRNVVDLPVYGLTTTLAKEGFEQSIIGMLVGQLAQVRAMKARVAMPTIGSSSVF